MYLKCVISACIRVQIEEERGQIWIMKGREIRWENIRGKTSFVEKMVSSHHSVVNAHFF